MPVSIQIEQIPYYLTWQVRHEVMYPELPLNAVKLPNDPDGLHFGLYQGNKLTSILSLFDQGDTIQLRKFATLDAEQGKGFGKMLLQYAIDFSRKAGAKTIWCNARENASGFYISFGFYRTNETHTAFGYDFVKMMKDLA